MLVSDAGIMLPPLPSINIGTFREKNVLTGRLAPHQGHTGSNDAAGD
jgi:hypothetical protein